jgi:hypothetical protein
MKIKSKELVKENQLDLFGQPLVSVQPVTRELNSDELTVLAFKDFYPREAEVEGKTYYCVVDFVALLLNNKSNNAKEYWRKFKFVNKSEYRTIDAVSKCDTIYCEDSIGRNQKMDGSTINTFNELF